MNTKNNVIFELQLNKPINLSKKFFKELVSFDHVYDWSPMITMRMNEYCFDDEKKLQEAWEISYLVFRAIEDKWIQIDCYPNSYKIANIEYLSYEADLRPVQEKVQQEEYSSENYKIYEDAFAKKFSVMLYFDSDTSKSEYTNNWVFIIHTQSGDIRLSPFDYNCVNHTYDKNNTSEIKDTIQNDNWKEKTNNQESKLFVKMELDEPHVLTPEYMTTLFSYNHVPSCCEEVYVDFEHIHLQREEMEKVWKVNVLLFKTAPEDWFYVNAYYIKDLKKRDNNDIVIIKNDEEANQIEKELEKLSWAWLDMKISMFFPCRNIQNWFYSDNLDIVFNNDKESIVVNLNKLSCVQIPANE